VEFEEYQQRVADLNSKLTTDALNSPEGAIRERLASLTPGLWRFVTFYDKASVDKILDGSKYESLNQIMADLVNVGYTGHGSVNTTNYAMPNKELLRLTARLWDEAKYSREKLTKFIDSGVPQAEEATATTAGVSVEQMADIPFAQALLDKHGIQAKRNTKPVKGKGAYAWIGLFDPKGYGHVLQKSLAGKGNPNKERLGAVWYSKAGDEMENYWLIPADVDPSIVADVFDL
jgi:hypothetical protein